MPIEGFDHVAILISDPDYMLNFYRRLGFDIEDGSPPFFAKIRFHARLKLRLPLWGRL